ncbi:MAG: hypothetical protein BV459_03295 [Thermoplasmata archaeon M11B2D]|nr:MAG: hypothetical protein BV459_03295 [Thermoplasmata archaeon M11B2D]
MDFAKNTETVVSDILKSRNFKIIDFCDTKDFDLLVEHPTNGKTYSIEIKEDFMAADTGNVAVEYECRGKSSGIASTRADAWAYVLHERARVGVYLISTIDLMSAIRQDKHHREVIGGDFGSNTKMCLFRVESFKSMCFCLESDISAKYGIDSK